jgi:8-oxo-dGTP diphosphatase
VKPSYYHHWLLPGGRLEAGESPAEGIEREVKEEIGLTKKINQLLSAHYISKGAMVGVQGQPRKTKDEEISLVFFGGNISSEELGRIQVDGVEIIDFNYLPVDEALKFLPNYHQVRIPQSIKSISNNGIVYFEGIEKAFEL